MIATRNNRCYAYQRFNSIVQELRNKLTCMAGSACEGGQVVKMGHKKYCNAIVKELKFYLFWASLACLLLLFGHRYRTHCALFSFLYSISSWRVKVVI